MTVGINLVLCFKRNRLTINILVPYFPIIATPSNVGYEVDVFGYGWTSYMGDVAPSLQALITYVTDKETCVDEFGSDIANEDVFCATPRIRSALCNGDQGGPVLLYPEDYIVVCVAKVNISVDAILLRESF